VAVYNNPGGCGDYETHIDLINRINCGILERLVISAMQAFRQRVITGGQLQERDANGNQIDYAKVFAPAPGALWNLPKELEIWESTPMELTPILNASKEDIRTLSAVTCTPLPMLIPDNTNTSAEGAKATETGYLARCSDRLCEVKHAVEEVMKMALAMVGDPYDDSKDELCVLFQNPDRVTVQEKYAAALAAHNAGESWPSIERNILGYSPEQIAQDRQDRIHESMLAATLPPIPTTIQERITATPAPGQEGEGGQSGPAPGPTTPGPAVKAPAATSGGKKVPTTQGGNQTPGQPDYKAPGAGKTK
jgi:hypothetical protein